MIIDTPEQVAFLNELSNTNNSIVLEAVAGSGKTTTLLKGVSRMRGSTMICAFNKAIAEELKVKLNKMGFDWKVAQASTVHAIGFGAYRKAFPNVAVDGNKMNEIINNLFEIEKVEEKELFSMVKGLVSLAKQSGIGLLHPISDVTKWIETIEHFDVINSAEIDEMQLVKLAQTALKTSNNITDVIDFDDMVYLPLVKRVRFWQFDNVMVDEAQDINATRRAMIKAITKPGGRVIACGDKKQAIYGFTGADANSLDIIKKEFNAKTMPLTVCFRCGSDIIKFAQQWNPVITAAPANGAGLVNQISMEDFMKMNHAETHVMLCRNTKPLVVTAFEMIKNGTAVYVEGRDIGEGLKKLAGRWKVKTADALINRLGVYLEKELAKFVAKGQEDRAQAVEDKVQTLLVIIDRCIKKGVNTVSGIVLEIDTLFQDTDGKKKPVFTLSTIHRSKGREWNRVFWLDRAGTLPSKWARQEWQVEQEFNLAYVASTRAMKELTEVVM